MRTISFEDRGVINHIDDLASWVMGSFKMKDWVVEDWVVMVHAMIAPRRVTLAGRSLKYIGRNGSVRRGREVQLIVAPPAIAPVVRNRTGMVMFLSSLFVGCKGVALEGHHAAEIINRVEYAAVAPVARKNIRIKIGL